MTGTGTVRRFVAAGLLAALVGCGDGLTGPEGTPAAPPDVRAYVTGAALENLDANGHFRLPPATVASPYAMMSGERAKAIALGVIRTLYANPDAQTVPIPGAISAVEAAERQHGAPVDWDAVAAGERVPYLAESPYERLPERLGGPAIRNFGPQFLVPLYVGGTPVVVVGVAAYATNVRLDARGFVWKADSLDAGGEFYVGGVPLSLDGVTVPPSPEVAVRFAATETGAKVRAVPVLGMPGNRVVRTHARWRLRLAEPVVVERMTDGATVVTEDVYVGVFPSFADARTGIEPAGPALRLFVAAESQPAVQEVGSASVALRPGYAVDLHEAMVPE